MLKILLFLKALTSSQYLDIDGSEIHQKHTHMGRIEKVLRKHQNIFIPDQYRDIIKSASTKDSSCLNMDHFFHNFEELPAKHNLFKTQLCLT